MENFNFNNPEIHGFAYWGKKGVDALEKVDVAKVANELYKLVCNYDKAFSTRLYKSIQKGVEGEEVLKTQIAALSHIAWQTILTNKTLEEVKAKKPNIEKEVKKVLGGIEAADYDDFYVFFNFLNTCSQKTEDIFTKELNCPPLIAFEDGFGTVLYYLKEWLGLREEDDLFKDENERVEALDVEFECGEKDFYKAFSSDYEDGDEEDPADYAYREMYYDHFHR